MTYASYEMYNLMEQNLTDCSDDFQIEQKMFLVQYSLCAEIDIISRIIIIV